MHNKLWPCEGHCGGARCHARGSLGILLQARLLRGRQVGGGVAACRLAWYRPVVCRLLTLQWLLTGQRRKAPVSGPCDDRGLCETPCSTARSMLWHLSWTRSEKPATAIVNAAIHRSRPSAKLRLSSKKAVPLSSSDASKLPQRHSWSLRTRGPRIRRVLDTLNLFS